MCIISAMCGWADSQPCTANVQLQQQQQQRAAEDGTVAPSNETFERSITDITQEVLL